MRRQALPGPQIGKKGFAATLGLLPGIGLILLPAAPAFHGQPSLLPDMIWVAKAARPTKVRSVSVRRERVECACEL